MYEAMKNEVEDVSEAISDIKVMIQDSHQASTRIRRPKLDGRMASPGGQSRTIGLWLGLDALFQNDCG